VIRLVEPAAERIVESVAGPGGPHSGDASSQVHTARAVRAHPRPGETVTRYPKVLRKRALDCVCAVQDVLEDLYA